MENQNATRPTAWELSEGFNDPLRWIHDSQKALGTLYDHVRHELAAGTIGVVQDILSHAERDLLALQEKIATTARAQRAQSDAAVVSDDSALASFADAVENYRRADAAAHQDGSDEDQAAWDEWGEAFDAAMHYPVTTAEELRAKVALFSEYHLADRFAENMPAAVCDQIRAVFSDAVRVAEQPAPGNYGILQGRITALEAVAAQPGLDRAYRLTCDLDAPLTDIRDVRHSLVALSMVHGLEDWQAGSASLAFRELDRALEAIDDLTDPIAIDWREANGLRPDGGLPESVEDEGA